MEDAYSENVRQGITDWFYGEVLPRLRPGGKVVAIGTRFHYADLFAELEASGRYKVIRLSAVAEEEDELGRPVGTYLWADQPDTYPYSEYLAQQRDVLPPRIWSSLYMNNPSPEQGDYFKTNIFARTQCCRHASRCTFTAPATTPSAMDAATGPCTACSG